MTGQLWPGDQAGLDLAAVAVRARGVIGFPTDTVFGIGCSAVKPEAVSRLCAIKARPKDQPLILMAATWREMGDFVDWPAAAFPFLRHFWPGPLTLIVGALPMGAVLGGGGTVGVRVPAHPVALRLLRLCGPLATSSANRHGQPPADDAESALRLLPGLAGALADLEPSPVPGAPSSILDLTRDRPVLLREGRLSARELGIPEPEQEPGIRRD